MRRTLPQFYTESQMITLATTPDHKTRTGLRARAILGLLCAAGLRNSETCSLDVQDITPTLVHVRHGKGGHDRIVPITANCYRALGRYLAVHPAKPHQPLFRTSDGQRFTRHCMYKLIRFYSRKAGLRGGVHTVRHSAATLWLNKGLDLVRVKVMLGHAFLSSTEIYVGNACDELVRQYQAAMQRPSLARAA